MPQTAFEENRFVLRHTLLLTAPPNERSPESIGYPHFCLLRPRRAEVLAILSRHSLSAPVKRIVAAAIQSGRTRAISPAYPC